MAGANVIPVGNDEVIAKIPLIVEIIARTASWVHPDTFRQPAATILRFDALTECRLAAETEFADQMANGHRVVSATT